MSLFAQQPKRKVHSYDEQEIAEQLEQYSEEPYEFTDEEAEEVFNAFHNFRELAKAGYIKLEPETLKTLEKF